MINVKQVVEICTEQIMPVNVARRARSVSYLASLDTLTDTNALESQTVVMFA